MALTSGDRKSKATVSSIQSRMGVVDTYSGKNALGLAAEGASAVLDIFAERQANKEEVAWKTDFKLKTRNTLTNYAREHYDDPDAFTNSVNTYRDSLTNSTPTRFKNYAKEYIGNLAFEYGDKIWQEAKNQQDLLILDNFLTNHTDFIADRNQAIMGYTAEEMQTYWTTSLLPEMSDAMADYEKLYNSYPAAIQQQLADQYGTPDSVDKNGNPVEGTFNKTLAIGFETQRLISLAKQQLDFAQAQDTAFMQQMGGIPENYITQVEKVNKALAKYGLDYIDNPLFDVDDSSVYKNTNREERATISSSVGNYIETWNKANEKNVKKQEILIDQNKIDVVANTKAAIKDGNTYNEDRLRVIATENGLELDQLNDLMQENAKMIAIQDVSSQITYFDSGKIITTMSQFDVNTMIYDRVRTINNRFGEGTITADELKDEAMMQQMYELVSIEFPNMSRNVFNNMPLSTIGESGLSQNNLFLTSLLELSRTYGAVPDKLEQYFASAGTLNFEQPNDRQELRNMAEFANNLSLTKGIAPAFSNDEANYLFPHLLKLHKEFERMGKLDAELANRTEQEINDILGKNTIGEYEELVIEKWIGEVYPDQTLMDEKIEYLNQVIVDNNVDINGIMYDFFKDREEDGPWWGLFLTDQDLLTGNVEVNLFGDDRDLEPNFNLVLQEAKEMFDVRIASLFGNTSYKATMTPKAIKKALKEQLPYILNTLRTAGYGYSEN